MYYLNKIRDTLSIIKLNILKGLHYVLHCVCYQSDIDLTKLYIYFILNGKHYIIIIAVITHRVI